MGAELDSGLLLCLYYFSSQRDHRKFGRLTHKGLMFLRESFKPKLLLLKYFPWNRRCLGFCLVVIFFFNNLLAYKELLE